jgi:hypothetical protein
MASKRKAIRDPSSGEIVVAPEHDLASGVAPKKSGYVTGYAEPDHVREERERLEKSRVWLAEYNRRRREPARRSMLSASQEALPPPGPYEGEGS